MKKIILIIFLLAVSVSYSQDKAAVGTESKAFLGAVPEELEKKCDSFFALLQQGKLDEAYDSILKNSPIHDELEQVDNLVKSTKKIIKNFGAVSGYEAVNSEAATDSYIRLRYLGLHEDLPIRWIFTFYKSPARGWILTRIKFDTETYYYFTDE
jgi:hypothetical protein